MLEALGSSLISLLLGIPGKQSDSPATAQMLSWQESELFSLPPKPDPAAEAMVQKYLDDLSEQGIVTANQGIWIQSNLAQLASHQGKDPSLLPL
ncbi:MAG: hypothetical protein BRC40_01710 [Cyanobacteria bacterium QH_8_48_120]|jgi:D-alanyl-D-alanine carboxypeptidase/D-alanyl-D-alanine-endopeptidase (penicillin-binding protein 4)|nr:MAG: hypothetical protein BRC39_11800 [Cyanobacteria bacterium QH_7_48_89]PSO77581.1 MAG: hypothetical protein BRC40_01710 [Cyanobacteria bacterium QH_8_48_120]